MDLNSGEFNAICGWPFADPFVTRLLREDIPQRVEFGNCRMWSYRDPQGRLAGFGTLQVCEECREFTNGKPHPYIPLLAKNPTIPSLGYGTSILNHLINEAALQVMMLPGWCHDILFLDVYTASQRAIDLYVKCGFVSLTPQPIADPQEGGKTYIIMAKRISVAGPASGSGPG